MKCALVLPSPPQKISCVPLWPRDFKLVGDAVSDAYNAAVNARNAALQKYNPDNTQQSADAAQYNTDITEWNTNGGSIAEPDHTTCQNALSSANTARLNETAMVANAYDHFGAGDTNLTNGDNAQNPQQKIQYYNAAKDHYNAASASCTSAEGYHSDFVGFISTAEGILY